MSEAATARSSAWEALTEGGSTTAETHTSIRRTLLRTRWGLGKRNLLLRAPSLLTAFYEEQTQPAAAYISSPNVDIVSPLCFSSLQIPLFERHQRLIKRDIPTTFFLSGRPLHLTATTFLFPPEQNCVVGGYVRATTGSVVLSDPLQMAPMEINITTFDAVTATRVARQVEQAFTSAVEETFEDGVHSGFEKTLASLIRLSGNDALKAIERMLESPNTSMEIAGEALRRLGEVEDEQSRKYRLGVLNRYLRSSSSRLRYAAALGLASMDDPDAIPPVLEAIASETQPDVLRSLRQVLEQLQETERCRGT